MDRSFLSQAEVIDASRKFVCVRLTSYEDQAESAFCRSLMVGRSGEVENTTFTILAPNGRTTLIRTSRSAKGPFANAADMARQMTAISEKYSSTQSTETPPLPIALNARVALDVAACDNQPLLLAIADTDAAREKLEAQVAALAWSSDFIGRFTYATAASAKELTSVKNIPAGDGFAMIEPDAFGQSGRLLHFVNGAAAQAALAQNMRDSVTESKVTAKSRQAHRAAGMALGAFWETRFPVTDPEEAQARERAKKEIERRRQGS